jgi:hypothetical protein
MYNLLIQNCTIVSPDSEIPRILPEHDIAVQDQRIAFVYVLGMISNFWIG